MSEEPRWYRVFCQGEDEPKPEALLAGLHEASFEPRAEFQGDELGWLSVKFWLGNQEEPLEVQRFVAGGDDIRADLNTWAAWVEAQTGCDFAWLMQHLVTTRQLFVWHVDAADSESVAFSAVLCDLLSRMAGGVYQVDGHGFFDIAGTHLVRE